MRNLPGGVQPLRTIEDGFAMHGFRPFAPSLGSKYLFGRRYAAFTLTTATANDSADLTTSTAWAKDKAVSNAYGSEVPEAVLHVQSLHVWFPDDTWRVLSPAIKEQVLDELHLRVKVGSETKEYNLGQHIFEGFTPLASATLEVASVRGEQLVFHEPWEATLDVDDIALETDTSIAHGGLTGYVVFNGALFPKSAPREAGKPGMCGGGARVSPQTFISASNAAINRGATGAAGIIQNRLFG